MADWFIPKEKQEKKCLTDDECGKDQFCGVFERTSITSAEGAHRNSDRSVQMCIANEYKIQDSVSGYSWEANKALAVHYKGKQNKSETGRDCMKWSDSYSFQLQYIDEEDKASNYCRSINGDYPQCIV